MKKMIRKMSIIAVIAAAAIFLKGTFLNAGEPDCVYEADEGLQLPGEQEKEKVTVEEVEVKLNEIGELSTVEGEYTVDLGKNFSRYFLDDIKIPGTTNSIEMKCKGIVKVGYDFDQIGIRIDEVSKHIYITLPEPQINSNEIIFDENMECIEKNNVLNPIDFEQYRSMFTEIKEKGLKEAEEKGLYENVEKNAQHVIENFLGCFTAYTVEFL